MGASLKRALAWVAVIGFFLSPVAGPAAASPTCPPNNGHVWFLGVVYDSEKREDFQLDVDNFVYFLSALRTVYCIPAAQAKILAFENGYTRNSVTYDAATESAVKAQLATFGSAASAFSDSIFFFFLSSHGTVYPSAFTSNQAIQSVQSCAGGIRLTGSLSVLKPGSGEDGDFHDCELGAALNTNFDADVRMMINADCSFCGGFSDSTTAVSGTLPDNSLPVSSGIPKANRIVMTGCAQTTECFGGDDGAVSYGHMKSVLQSPLAICDGYTTPGFPTTQGADVPVKLAALNAPDGRCTASEWIFAAVITAYGARDAIGIQQQFRIKYGFATLADDLQIR